MKIKLHAIFLDKEGTKCLTVNGHKIFDCEINEDMENTIPLFTSERDARLFAQARGMIGYHVSQFPENDKYPSYRPAIVSLLPDGNWFLCEVSWAD